MSFKRATITLTIGTVIGFGLFQSLEIHKDAKADANFQKTVENMKNNEAKLQIVVDSLKSKINEYSAYPVSYSSATIKCFSKHVEEVKYVKNIFTGEILKKPFSDGEDWVYSEPTIYTYASAESKFNHDVNFSTSDTFMEDNKIVVEIDKAYLNVDSIVPDMTTFKELEAETVGEETYKNYMNNDASLLDLRQNAQQKEISSIKTNARTGWQIKYVEIAPDEINKLYETDEERKLELEQNTISSVKNLVSTLLVDTLKELNVVSEDVELEVRIRA